VEIVYLSEIMSVIFLLDISENHDEKIKELCAVQVNTIFFHSIAVCIHRSILTLLDFTVKYLYRPRTQFLICRDISVNYLMDRFQKKQLMSLLSTYNSSH
jgi:hypothetical protein